MRSIEPAVKALIFNDYDEVLLMHRHSYPNEIFELPGGRLEFGETFEDALSREINEETNLKLKSFKLIDTWKFNNENYQISGLIYLCKTFDNNIKISNEHDFYRWHKFDKSILEKLHDVFKIKIYNWDFEEISDIIKNL